MSDLLATARAFVAPAIELPSVRARLEQLDQHFFVTGSTVALLITLLMWANI